jgi:hypothetical protein
MNDARFNTEKADEGRIDVRDHHTGLLFSFQISDKIFGETFGNEYPVNENARREARLFAQDEARKRGWIDQL